MQFDITAKDIFNENSPTVVLNCGKPITLEDGTILRSFDSGLFDNYKIKGENLITFAIGEDLEVSEKIADYCRANWTAVYDIFPDDQFKNADFFRSSKTKIGVLEFNFWYCGKDFSCGIHNKHDFFELHTQILGRGEMQKFQENDESTLYYREILSSGQTHAPFYNIKGDYPHHRYKSITKCIWLAIESPAIFLV